jgi:hypothetical protein
MHDYDLHEANITRCPNCHSSGSDVLTTLLVRDNGTSHVAIKCQACDHMEPAHNNTFVQRITVSPHHELTAN